MNKEEALEWIHGRSKFKIKPGLERMEWLAEKLGHPEKAVPVVHIAGTNGKGSTTSFLKYLLMEQGYSVGTFTSPYITHFNERISLNEEAIDDEELIRLIYKVKPLVEEAASLPGGEPTEFEVITIMSFLYFQEKNVDIAIIETGLGGLYDSTNIVAPLLSVITNIGLDHQDILGHSYGEIAAQKAGIVKSHVPVISGVRHQEAKKVIKETSRKLHAPLYELEKDFSVGQKEAEQQFIYRFRHEDTYELSMLGAHQKRNAALAVTSMEVLKEFGWKISRVLYGKALKEMTWPGRMEIISRNPLTLLDGAHNYEGTEALVETMENLYKDSNVHVIYGAVEGKPAAEMLGMLKKIAASIATVSFDFPKSLKKEDYLNMNSDFPYFMNPEVAYRSVLNSADAGDVILWTGSLYFISEVRKMYT
ncbi:MULTISPECIES: bifunctional folylpolyglutamate synthase/dihydrofolate synthase [Salimicrobium]|uniref:tetrahydrofolate synthase n=2 Tax=Salimicrobium TaxID=351195 RepID=A0ABY1KSM0_9BACI|nr:MULTISPECIES: folylpolyglutamate synthase/dihydrofolate synthase family protein [Salimicrobium]SDX63909.1 dihydrofolate synthase / folylpolyglutamate synthase [Salimicrobium album]SIS50784.1 dihydrofolate synthase / folylpolyglutamate synthase [Salimicrobium salexigens]